MGRRQLIAEMGNEENLLLVERQRRAASDTRYTTLIVVGGFVFALLLIGIAGAAGQSEIRRRHVIESALKTAHDDIAFNLKDAQDRSRERSILSELAGRLQSCRTLAEGLPFMSRGMSRCSPRNQVLFSSPVPLGTFSRALRIGVPASPPKYRSRRKSVGRYAMVACKSWMQQMACCDVLIYMPMRDVTPYAFPWSRRVRLLA